MKLVTADMTNWVTTHVQGTCTWGGVNGLVEFNKHFGIPEDDDDLFLKALEEAELFECTVCGWYAEVSEMSDRHCEPTCQDCADEDEE